MAVVKEIQVYGGKVTDNLLDSFIEYMACWQSGNTREKINFAILLDDGSTKHITFRPEDSGIEVYGDFEGMPNFLEWAKSLKGK